MATPPLPDFPTVRVRLDYTDETSLKSGSRIYLRYSGSAPTAANCVTLADDVAAAWNTELAGQVNTTIALTEVDVLDIATDSGSSGQWSGSNAGTLSGTNLPMQVAVNIEYDIARRYRGGKPRMYLPPPTTTQQQTPTTWSTTYTSGTNTAVAAFFATLEALSIGSMGTISHVSVSYYKGYQNIEIPDTRAYAKPLYRTPTAVSDIVEGYSTKILMGSQRRRRTSTTY